MANNFIFIVFDSCRRDSFMNAETPNIDRLGRAAPRYSYASWTVPSHAAYLMGVSPHRSPKDVFASEVYKDDFRSWSERLGIENISFQGFVPELSLPAFLKTKGYETHARVSLPVLNQRTIFNRHFDSYLLMPEHNDFRQIVSGISFDSDRPQFYFINVGETHYPYTLPGEKAEDLPLIHGVHGVWKRMDDFSQAAGRNPDAPAAYEKHFAMLKEKQRCNVEYLDSVMAELYDKAPQNTYILITSDHGEMFGEDGYFGHGPIFHEKVFEVFLLEGLLK
jgi:arylsulfatase A-like enzyme